MAAGDGYWERGCEPDAENWEALKATVLEFENVGLGITGPMERRDAAKSGSRASRSIAMDVTSG